MVAGGWCRACWSAEAMSAETRAQEGELFGGLNSVLQSCAHTSVPSVSCLRLLRGPYSVWPLLGCQ